MAIIPLYSAGMRFGRLLVLSNFILGKRRFYSCKCDCGNERNVRADAFKKVDFTKSCGCLTVDATNSRNKIYRESVAAGDVFGNLTALTEPRTIDGCKSKANHVLCQCVCGNRQEVILHKLLSGKSVSCGCKKFRFVDESGNLYCPTCNQFKTKAEFFRSKMAHSGYCTYCKVCSIASCKRRDADNPIYAIRRKITSRKWAKDYPVKNCARAHRYRARKANCEGFYTSEEWIDLCNQYGNVCLRCGQPNHLTVDHVVPITKKGRNDISNLQPLCRSCNSFKGNRTTDYRK